jgi:hypothetical protein
MTGGSGGASRASSGPAHSQAREDKPVSASAYINTARVLQRFSRPLMYAAEGESLCLCLGLSCKLLKGRVCLSVPCGSGRGRHRCP